MIRYAFALLFAVAALGSPANAADPQTYRLDIASVGNGDFDATLKATSELRSLRKTAPVSPFGLIARARSDIDRLTTTLESYGYYQCKIAIQINGMTLSNPALAEALNALPKGSDARVAISFTLGPLYHLRRIEIDGDLPEGVRSTLKLNSGDPAVADTVLAAGARLANALQERGYAFARVDPPIAEEAADEAALDLRFHVEAGSKVNIGDIRIEGLQRVHEKVLRARLLLRTGDPYSPAALERARRDLLLLGVFTQVSLQIGTAPDAFGGVPITFKVRERKRHTIGVDAAFSSDLGGSGGVTWGDRNVFGNAEQLSITAHVINLGGSDATGVGYDTNAKYVMPDFGHRDQSLQFTVGALKQSLQAYDQTARTSSVTLNRKISSSWSVSAGVATTDEQIIQEASTHYYTLVALPMNVAYDSTNLASPLEDPRRGIRASLTLTPTVAIGNPDATFIISQVKLAGFFDLDHLFPTDPGRSVLAARVLAGLAQGAGEYSLPPDQRFYAGGSGTIRGYRYQSVGPQFPITTLFPNPTPIGGSAITAGSVEFRQRFGTNFGAAIFMDAGQVSATLKGLPGESRVGAGAGLRYYTPIGPIRLDLAAPAPRRPGDDALEFYIGLGQAF